MDEHLRASEISGLCFGSARVTKVLLLSIVAPLSASFSPWISLSKCFQMGREDLQGHSIFFFLI